MQIEHSATITTTVWIQTHCVSPEINSSRCIHTYKHTRTELLLFPLFRLLSLHGVENQLDAKLYDIFSCFTFSFISRLITNILISSEKKNTVLYFNRNSFSLSVYLSPKLEISNIHWNHSFYQCGTIERAQNAQYKTTSTSKYPNLLFNGCLSAQHTRTSMEFEITKWDRCICSRSEFEFSRFQLVYFICCDWWKHFKYFSIATGTFRVLNGIQSYSL